MTPGFRMTTLDDQGRTVQDWMNAEPIELHSELLGVLTFQPGSITMTFTEPDD